MLLPKASVARTVVVIINTSRSGPARGVTVSHTSWCDNRPTCRYDAITCSLSGGIEAICETCLVCCLFRCSIKFGRDGLIVQLLLARNCRIFSVISSHSLGRGWLSLVHYKGANRT